MTDDLYAGSDEPIYCVASYSADDGINFYPIHRLVRTREEAVEAVRSRLLYEFTDPEMFDEEDEDEYEAEQRIKAEALAVKIKAMDFWALLSFAEEQDLDVSITRLQVGFEKWV